MSFSERVQRGFTLIEVLTVLVIISVLISIVYVSFTGARERARNKSIQSSLKETQLALEVFKAQNGQYPVATATCGDTSGTVDMIDDSVNCFGRSWIPGLVPEYTQELPSREMSNVSSCAFTYYVKDDGSAFKLAAEACIEGVDQTSGTQPGDEFAACPLSCGSGACPGSTVVDGEAVYSNADGWATYAVYSPGGGCIDK